MLKFGLLIIASLIWLPVEARELTIETTNGYYPVYQESHALVVGVGKYVAHPSWENLTVVDEEIVHVSEALIQQGFNVDVLNNPTYQQLDQALRTFLTYPYDQNTRLLVYYAGHGWSDLQAHGYVVPSDGRVQNDPIFVSSLMSFEQIDSYARLSTAKHVMIVFNSCFSGWALRASNNLIPNEAYIRDIDRKTIQYITSGSRDEAVPDSPAFYEAFVAGISGEANMYYDNIVTADELGYWLKFEIARGGQQTPQYGRSRDVSYRTGDMVFAQLIRPPRPLRQESSGEIVELPSPVPASQALVVLEPPRSVGPRESNLRSLGQAANPIFQGIEVVYYQKMEDGTRIENALKKRAVPYVTQASLIPGDVGVNAIACGPDTPIDAVRSLASLLISAGVPIRNIISFRKPLEKPMRIELLSLTQDSAGLDSIDLPELSLADVVKIKRCPINLANGMF